MRTLILLWCFSAQMIAVDVEPIPAAVPATRIWATALDPGHARVALQNIAFNRALWLPLTNASDASEAPFIADAIQDLAARDLFAAAPKPADDPRIRAGRLVVGPGLSAAAAYWGAITEMTTRTGDRNHVIALLDHAWSRLPAEASYQRFLVARRMCWMLADPRSQELPAGQVDWAERLATAGVAALVEPRAQEPVGRRLTCENLGQDMYDRAGFHQPLRERVEAALATPGLHPGLVGGIRGRIEITKAWMARGGGFANTVTKDGWDGFAAHLAAARKALEAGYAADPGNPDICSSMIVVCMGESAPEQESRLWFARAMASTPDHVNSWRWILETRKPRWGGSYDAMLALGHEVLATKCFASDAIDFFPYTLMTIAEDMTNGGPDPAPLWSVPQIWPLVETYCTGIAAQGRKRDALLIGAGMAWRTGHRDLAANRLSELEREAAKSSLEREFAYWSGASIPEVEKALITP